MNALFPSGNADSWNYAIASYLPKATSLITKTVDPVICAALLALTGNSSDFARDSGIYQFSYDEDGLPFQLQATLSYSVPSFRVASATEEAIGDDKAFILAYLQQLSGIKIQAVKLDTKAGALTVSISVKVGYGND